MGNYYALLTIVVLCAIINVEEDSKLIKLATYMVGGISMMLALSIKIIENGG